MYWTGKSINNLLPYCGLVDAVISASEKDLPVKESFKNCKSFKVLFINRWKTGQLHGTIPN